MDGLLRSTPQTFYPGYTRPFGLTLLSLLYWATATGGVIFGAAILVDLIFISGLRPLTTALFSLLAAGPIVIGALQAIIGLNLFGLRRMAWREAMAMSLIQIFVAVVLVIVGYFLVSRSIQSGGIADLLADLGFAFPVYGVVLWESIVGIFVSFLTLAYLSRRNIRSIFGALRLQPYRAGTTPSQTRGGGFVSGTRPPTSPNPTGYFNPFYPMMNYPFPMMFPPPAQPSTGGGGTQPVERTGPHEIPSTQGVEKFCRHCGVRIRRPASYCVSCGSRIA